MRGVVNIIPTHRTRLHIAHVHPLLQAVTVIQVPARQVLNELAWGEGEQADGAVGGGGFWVGVSVVLA